MLDPAILIGAPLRYKGDLYIYPPLVKDVVTNNNFNIFYKVLTMTQDDIGDELRGKLRDGEKMPSPFEYLFLSC
jgi:hypothetical protein